MKDKIKPADLREEIAKWLFKNRHRLPNQRFYANWHDEIGASPLTEEEYLNLATEELSIVESHIRAEMPDKSIERIAEELGVNFYELHPYIIMREKSAKRAERERLIGEIEERFPEFAHTDKIDVGFGSDVEEYNELSARWQALKEGK